MDLSHKTFVDIANIMISGKRGKHEERTMFSSISVKQLAVTLLQSPKYIDTGTKESSVSLRTQLSRRLGLAQPACLPLQFLLAHRPGNTQQFILIHHMIATEASKKEEEETIFTGVCVHAHMHTYSDS